MVERFADFPRPLFLARGQLQIAPREVDADAIAVDVVERLVGGNVESAALQRHDQFDFVMQILGQRRGGDRGGLPPRPVRGVGQKKQPGGPLCSPPPSYVREISPPPPPHPPPRRIHTST